MAAALCALVFALIAAPRASATTANGTINVKWDALPVVHIQLTTNYNAGCGTVPALIGTQPTPHPGPDALNCTANTPVDFGPVLAGEGYLYKYAVHLNIVSNDSAGTNVYGEGAAAFYLTPATSGTSMAVTSLYYLPSGATSDANTGFSPSTPFLLTNGTVSGYNPNTAPTISYLSYPSPIAIAATNNSDFYWDYQLKVPFSANGNPGKYYVWVVYTVVGR